MMSALDKEAGISEQASALEDKAQSLMLRTLHRRSHWKAGARDEKLFSDGLAQNSATLGGDEVAFLSEEGCV